MLTLVLRVLFDARIASHVGAVLAGEPELGPVLEHICERESHCSMLSVHKDDAGRSREAWEMAVAVGWLDPVCQPHEPRTWATRGAWGTYAAFTVHHLGRCWPAWAIDLPLLGAIAAANRAAHPNCRRSRACRSWLGVG